MIAATGVRGSMWDRPAELEPALGSSHGLRLPGSGATCSQSSPIGSRAPSP